GWAIRPPVTSCRGWSRYSNEAAMPKSPPPPQSAQRRSGCDSAVTFRIPPLAVTSSTPSRLSAASPCFAISQPSPPPRVRPAIPGEANRVDDVGRVPAARDQRRPPVDQSVVDSARLLEALVLRLEQLAGEGRPERPQLLGAVADLGRHAFPSPRVGGRQV